MIRTLRLEVALEVTSGGVATDRAARVTVLPMVAPDPADRPKRGAKHRLRGARTRVIVRVPLRPGR